MVGFQNEPLKKVPKIIINFSLEKNLSWFKVGSIGILN